MPDRRYGRTTATAPGPSGPQMLAQLPGIVRDPVTFLLLMRREFGRVVQLPLARPTFLVDDPHLARSVLVSHAQAFDKHTPQYRALARITGDGLLAAPHDRWRAQRPVVQPAFHSGVVRRLVADTHAAFDRVCRRWALAPAGSVVDAQEAMARAALDVVGHHLFGADLGRAAPRLARATAAALDAVVSPMGLLLRRGRAPAAARRERAMRELDAAADALVRGRRQAADSRRDDLLGLLLAAYPRDHGMVRDQIVTFLVAGHETVASALTWALGLLAHNPREQDRARAEATRVLGGQPATVQSLANLPAVRGCYDEALRLYPPAWVITRTASRDFVLGGRRVPHGSLIILSPWVMHRNPAHWPRPEEFHPARFGGSDGADSAARRGEYLPFGLGQRMCIGRDMAVIEGCAALATLLRRFEFAPAAAALPRMVPHVTLRPASGMPLRLTPVSRGVRPAEFGAQPFVT